jgi:hypothetical protein
MLTVTYKGGRSIGYSVLILKGRKGKNGRIDPQQVKPGKENSIRS